MEKSAGVKVHIIYMAAGNSRRFGSNKLLTSWHGKPLYRYGLDLLLEVMQDLGKEVKTDLTVVTQYPEIYHDVAADPTGFQAVMSPESAQGASFTIRCGIESARKKFGPADYWLFVVADQPMLRKETIKKMLKQLPCEEPVVTAALQGSPCNPCMFADRLTEELLLLTGDEGGRKVARKYAYRKVEVTGPEEVRDLDTEEEFFSF